jgi:hypothetical protein
MRAAEKLLAALAEIRSDLSRSKPMTDTPTFDDLTPPDELIRNWCGGWPQAAVPVLAIYRAGARHGWEQAALASPDALVEHPQRQVRRPGSRINPPPREP